MITAHRFGAFTLVLVLVQSQDFNIGAFKEQTERAAWKPRDKFSAVRLQDDTLLVLGGSDAGNTFLDNVFKSENSGQNWVQVTDSPGWSNNPDFATTLLSDDTIVVLGGGRVHAEYYTNQIWTSSDGGRNWEERKSGSGDKKWKARARFVAIALSTDEVIVFGGFDGEYFSDTYQGSTPFKSWEELETPPWPARSSHAAVLLDDDSIIMMGGEGPGAGNNIVRFNDVWKYANSTWTQVLPNNPTPGDSRWSPRKDFQAVTVNNTIVVMGGASGHAGEGSYLFNDVWSSSNHGVEWTMLIESAAWPARSSFAAVTLTSGTIVLMGGNGGSTSLLHDVWRDICQPGFRDQRGECVMCATGKYQPKAGKESCLSCPEGKYQNEEGQNSCKLCPAGTANHHEGSTSRAACTNCEPGSYSDHPGSAVCFPCSIGKYEPHSGQTKCNDMCVPGTHGIITGGTSNGTACSYCAVGKYMPYYGKDECKDCPLGRFNPYTGKRFCEFPCLPGSHGKKTGAGNDDDACGPCAPGLFSPDYAFAKCLRCDVGSYSTLEGSMECELCPHGKYGIALGQNSEESACMPCAIGTYSDTVGMRSCKVCPAGKHTRGEGFSSCSDCPAGKYGSGGGECKRCRSGTVQPRTGQVDCTECPAGHISTDQISCTACPAGSYATRGDEVVCMACPEGKNQSKAGQTSCFSCPAGFVTVDGVTCKDCAPGKNAMGNRCESIPTDISCANTGATGWAITGSFIGGIFACLVVGGVTFFMLQRKRGGPGRTQAPRLKEHLLPGAPSSGP